MGWLVTATGTTAAYARATRTASSWTRRPCRSPQRDRSAGRRADAVGCAGLPEAGGRLSTEVDRWDVLPVRRDHAFGCWLAPLRDPLRGPGAAL